MVKGKSHYPQSLTNTWKMRPQNDEEGEGHERDQGKSESQKAADGKEQAGYRKRQWQWLSKVDSPVRLSLGFLGLFTLLLSTGHCLIDAPDVR